MRTIITAASMLAAAAGCSPIIDHGSHADPRPCVVWVTAGQPTGNVEPPCTINVVGMSRTECDHAGGQPRPWGCESIDY